MKKKKNWQMYTNIACETTMRVQEQRKRKEPEQMKNKGKCWKVTKKNPLNVAQKRGC